MSDPSPTSRLGLAALILLAALSCLHVWSLGLHNLPAEAAVVEGRFKTYFNVDSEHGELNGWFRPHITHDVYVTADDGREFQLWATPDTAFYRERGGALVRISVEDLGADEKIRAHVGEVDNTWPRPAAYALKVVAHE
jgi:hypothetical protein